MAQGLNSMENSKWWWCHYLSCFQWWHLLCRHCGELHNHTKHTFEITAHGFVTYVEQHPPILTPVYDAVHFLREKIMTLDYWKNACSQRMQLYEQRYIPSGEIIKFGGDVSVILKEQKIHRVDHLVRVGDEDWDNRLTLQCIFDDTSRNRVVLCSAPVVTKEKSIVQNLFKCVPITFYRTCIS